MTVEYIPTSALPAQELAVILDDQNCVIRLRQLADDLYADLEVDGTAVFSGRRCQINEPINCYPSLYFTGSLYFIDTLGADKPQWDGLNSRWFLCFEAADDE